MPMCHADLMILSVQTSAPHSDPGEYGITADLEQFVRSLTYSTFRYTCMEHMLHVWSFLCITAFACHVSLLLLV